jgi:hypothetical protein
MLMSMIWAPRSTLNLGAIGQVLRVGAGDLHRLRLHLAGVVGAARRLFAGPQARIRRRHLRHRIAGAELLAQLAERTIGHAGHRGDEDVIAQCVRANLHGERTGKENGNRYFTRTLLN